MIGDKSTESRKHMSLLKSLLRISDGPEESYQRTEGSCAWIDAREDFQEWRDLAGVQVVLPASTREARASVQGQNKNPSIFWVYANPGTGKTFLASHVADELAQFQLECASCFCQVGHESSHLAHLLRTLAYQMTSSNASVREKLMELYHEGGSSLDLDDAGKVWNKVFKKGVLQVRMARTVLEHLESRFPGSAADVRSRLVYEHRSIGLLTQLTSAASIRNFSP